MNYYIKREVPNFLKRHFPDEKTDSAVKNSRVSDSRVTLYFLLS